MFCTRPGETEGKSSRHAMTQHRCLAKNQRTGLMKGWTWCHGPVVRLYAPSTSTHTEDCPRDSHSSAQRRRPAVTRREWRLQAALKQPSPDRENKDTPPGCQVLAPTAACSGLSRRAPQHTGRDLAKRSRSRRCERPPKASAATEPATRLYVQTVSTVCTECSASSQAAAAAVDLLVSPLSSRLATLAFGLRQDAGGNAVS